MNKNHVKVFCLWRDFISNPLKLNAQNTCFSERTTNLFCILLHFTCSVVTQIVFLLKLRKCICSALAEQIEDIHGEREDSFCWYAGFTADMKVDTVFDFNKSARLSSGLKTDEAEAEKLVLFHTFMH